MHQPRPVDRNRIGRIVLAALDQDHSRVQAVVAEAMQEGTFLELFDTLGGAFIGMMRLQLGDEATRNWATDWVLNAYNT